MSAGRGRVQVRPREGAKGLAGGGGTAWGSCCAGGRRRKVESRK